jgi:mono/diheme cytochrome c family protein
MTVRTVPIINVVVLSALLTVLGTIREVSADPPRPVENANMPPVDLVRSAPKGTLVNPYKDTQASIVAEGETLFRSYSCSTCHGAAGAGGLCPPVTNDIWVYGGDDDTLFRLVALGSDQLQQQGYSRKGHESIVAPMPPFGAAIKSSDDLWKMLAFIRAHYAGDPDRKFGAAASR